MTADILDLLTDLEEYLSDREDVLDGDDGQPKPNRAMQLRVRVIEVLKDISVPAQNGVDII